MVNPELRRQVITVYKGMKLRTASLHSILDLRESDMLFAKTPRYRTVVLGKRISPGLSVFPGSATPRLCEPTSDYRRRANSQGDSKS